MANEQGAILRCTHYRDVDREVGDFGGAERGDHRDVGGIASPRHNDAANASFVHACVESPPAVAEKHFEEHQYRVCSQIRSEAECSMRDKNSSQYG